MMRGLAIFAVCAGLASAHAQQAENEAFSALEGEWVADCATFQSGATCRLEWSEGLGGDLMRVRYEVSAAGRERLFAGEAVYKPAEDGFEGYWSDSNGSLHPLDATFSDGVLTTLWGRPETEEGRTRYALDQEGRLLVTDWVKVDGAWREFMRAEYARAGERIR